MPTSATQPVQTSADRERDRARGVSRSALRDPAVRVAGLIGAAWVALFAVLVVLTEGHPALENLLNNGLYLVPVAAATLLSVRAARARSGRARSFWVVLAISNAGWLLGELLWAAYTFVFHTEPPFPSIADVFYLGSYAIVPVAVLLAFARHGALRTLLDASVMVVAIGTSGYLLLIEPQLAWGPSLATAVGIAYPLMGVLILMVIAGAAFGGHTRVPLSMRLVAAAFAITGLTDALYTHAVVLQGAAVDQWLNLGWQAEAVLLCLAAMIAARFDEGEPEARDVGARSSFGIVLAGVVATVVVIALESRDGSISPFTIALGAYAVLAVIASLHLTSREKQQTANRLVEALREQERLAITDGLTGLHNRRFFEAIVRLETERAGRNGCPLGLIVLDLDHFKHVNDTYGHPAGDTVLEHTARRLAAVLRTSDVVARYGGEEFAAVLPDSDVDTTLQIAERCREALAAEPVRLPNGTPVAVTASIGVAVLPDHAAGRDDLIRAADSALYTAKRLGRNQVRVGTTAHARELEELVGSSSVVTYLQNLADDIDSRQSIDSHSLAMAHWAAQVADELGLSPDARWLAVAGARLHDVGKVAVPDAILRKPGPLTDAEWAIVHEHPERGARLVALDAGLAEVAPVVLQHHERMDGAGYPAGMQEREIAVEARIVAVCDAWSAMRAARAYRPPLDRTSARQELLAGAGTQFDPVVVEAFLRLEERGTVGRLDVAEVAPLSS